MELKEMRDEIDKVDDAIFDLLKQRYYLIREVMAIKKVENKPLVDKEREKEIIERMGRKAEDSELDSSFIQDLFTRIIESGKDKPASEGETPADERNADEPTVSIDIPEGSEESADPEEKHDSDII